MTALSCSARAWASMAWSATWLETSGMLRTFFK